MAVPTKTTRFGTCLLLSAGEDLMLEEVLNACSKQADSVLRFWVAPCCVPALGFGDGEGFSWSDVAQGLMLERHSVLLQPAAKFCFSVHWGLLLC